VNTALISMLKLRELMECLGALQMSLLYSEDIKMHDTTFYIDTHVITHRQTDTVNVVYNTS
jgi:hypothetical protein